MLSSTWSIARNSFLEIIRQPVYAILLVMGMALIGFSPAITMFSMVEDTKLMVDIGLATVMLLGIVIAVLSVTQTISHEIENQTVGAILSKPVGRFLFVVAKFVGVTMAMAVAVYLMTVVLVITLRIGVPAAAWWRMDYPALLGLVGPLLVAASFGIYSNYFYRWNFTSTAVLLALPLYTLSMGSLLLVDRQWQFALIPQVFAERHAGQVAMAALLIWFAIWVISSLALAVSTRLNVVMNAIICLAVFFVGMTSQFLFGQFAGRSVLAWTAVRIVPNLQVFWVADKLMHELPYIPWPYVGVAAAYAVGLCATMLMAAAFLFEKREVI